MVEQHCDPYSPLMRSPTDGPAACYVARHAYPTSARPVAARADLR